MAPSGRRADLSVIRYTDDAAKVDPTTHELQQNLTLWPGGMKSFAEYLHGKGMQLSVYTDAGVKNCCQEPGSLGFEEIDMKTFASWGVDAVGIDYCGGPAEVHCDPDISACHTSHQTRSVHMNECEREGSGQSQ